MKHNSTLKLAELGDLYDLGTINAVWLAIMKMEPVSLELLLDDSIDYEDIGKERFIDKLRAHFDYHRSLGDTELELDLDSCKGCNCDQPISKFIGNNSGKHFALYFDMDENTITDIYQCNWYGSDFLDNLFQ